MDRISPDLEKNRQWVEETFQNCDDILHRQVFLNNGKDEGILVYVEVAVSNLMLEEHVIGLSDVQPLTTYEEGEAALLAGNGILFVQGDTCLYKISSKGYPGIGVSPAESEKVMRGRIYRERENQCGIDPKKNQRCQNESRGTTNRGKVPYDDSAGLYGRPDRTANSAYDQRPDGTV